MIRSGFGRRSPLFSLGKLVFQAPERGADTLRWLADDPAAAVPGGYFAWRRPFGATPRSVDPARARLLWEASLTAVFGDRAVYGEEAAGYGEEGERPARGGEE